MNNILNKTFRLSHFNTNIKTEFIAGLTTFLSCSYILFVNPLILSKTGMDIKALFLTTALISVIGCLLMAFFANLPVAMAPGMSSNNWFAFTVVLGLGFTWQQGLATIFIGGILFILFTITKLRYYLINALSGSLKAAIASGIGLFIASIGLKTAGIIVPGNTESVVAIGKLLSFPVIMTLLGVIFITILSYYRVQGSLLIIIFIISIIGLITKQSSFTGIISSPPSISPIFWHIDFSRIFESVFIAIAFAVFLMDFLDSTAAFMGLLSPLKLDLNNNRVKKAFLIDGITTPIAAVLGCTTMSPYLESSSGVAQGGKTGLTAFFVALFFAIAIFFSPLLTLIPDWATAPILLYVGGLTFTNLTKVDMTDLTEAIPGFIVVIIMPLTASIANGMGVGITIWVIVKLFTKKFNFKKHWILLLLILGYLIMLFDK